MTPRETVMLVRYVRALCPQQAIDEFTADAWHDLLCHLEFEDARNAVVAVVRKQPFVSPSEILAEAGRRQRLHPSSRTVAEALAASTGRELPRGCAVPPNAAYLAARDALTEKLRLKAQEALA